MTKMQQGQSAVHESTAPARTPILVLKRLDKRFGATHALKAVDLTFEAAGCCASLSYLAVRWTFCPIDLDLLWNTVRDRLPSLKTW